VTSMLIGLIRAPPVAAPAILHRPAAPDIGALC